MTSNLDRVSGMFMAWRSRFLPGYDGSEDGLVYVKLAAVVDRFVKQMQCEEYKGELLKRWKAQYAACGVTLSEICLNSSAWAG